MAIDLRNATTEQLQRALDLRQQIDALQAELKNLEAGEAAPAKRGRPPGKRTMSAAARAKIGAAQRARWLKKKAGAASAKAAKPGAKKKVNPKLLENLAKARAARAAKRAAAGK